MSEYHYCKIKDEKEIIEYEKLVYKGYITDKSNSLLEYLEIIEGNRMRLKLNKKYLVYYTIKKNEKIIAGMTAHINPSNEFICEKFGFKIDKDYNSCEGITFFVVDEEKTNFYYELISGNTSFFKYVLNDIRN